MSTRIRLGVMTLMALFIPSAFAQDKFEGWHLEPAINQAHLVMAVKVVSVGQVTVVEGAKTDTVLREYRFQPVKILKGLFQRDLLTMTSADLGITEDGTAPPLKEGEMRLLILTQSQGQTWGCVAASPGMSRFEERVPLLAGAEDPLIAVVETLIRVTESRSRRERAAILIEKLSGMTGVAAVPLLSSLKARADWAGQDEKTMPVLKKLLTDKSGAVRRGTVSALREILHGYARRADAPAAELIDLLRTETDTTVRTLITDSLGTLTFNKANQDALLLQLANAPTRQERLAATQALQLADNAAAKRAVLDALARLPLDEAPAVKRLYIKAAAKADAAGVEEILLTRLEMTLAARQSPEAEIEQLGVQKSRKAFGILLKAATDDQHSDRYSLALALGRLKDERAVPVLAAWLRDPEHHLHDYAMLALEMIDTDNAAKEIRPQLRREPSLALKLRIARFLARHGINDGYALATEHLADHGMTGHAALTLAALKDPRTAADLKRILNAKPGPRWQAAALAGLIAIGDADAKTLLLAILQDDRHPLADEAADAAGISGDADFLKPLTALIKSRNRAVSQSAMVAVKRIVINVKSSPHGLFGGDPAEVPMPAIDLPKEVRTSLSTTVNGLALDGYVDADSRLMAVGIARLLRGAEYPALLENLADQADLEGSTFLSNVIEAQRKLRSEKVW